ncbi:MAG: Stk1 family PASTA domain-containing Ser/Thr kinase [Bifidobacteriaceae bacterium]|jgi:serine/threonine-protein kinase|nr:Stk1 family PASTA domain-containing Ser/Thr kinase [Bifidobacteriaceae bacterium]
MVMPSVLGNRYELREMVGHGGMAEVHKAFDNRLQRVVAVKILRPALTQDNIFYSRFKREAEAAASLNHPNIVAVYDTGEEIVQDGVNEVKYPYIVMEYVEGDDLKTVLAARGRLDSAYAAKIMEGVLSALDYSHKHGVIHRDIKPGNIFISNDGTVKVMDFGIARAISDSSATMTQADTVVGTAQYLSPEQAKGAKVDARSDIYSAGCLLFEILTGKPPFSGENAVSIAYQHVSESHDLPSAIVPGLNPLWDKVVSRAMEKDAGQRYQTAFTFRQDVQAVANGGTLAENDQTTVMDALPMSAHNDPIGLPNDSTQIMQAIPDNEPARDKPKKKKSKKKIVIIAIIAVLAIAGASIFAWTSCSSKVTVPTLPANVTPNEAKAKIEAANLVFEELPDPSSNLPSGTYTHSDPAGGTMVEPQSTVKVYFSKGPEDLKIPDLKNATQDLAQKTLTDMGLTVGSVKSEDSPDVSKDCITRTDPAAGDTAKAGETVTLYISTGNVQLPDLTGKSKQDAQDELKSLHLTANFQDDRTDDKTPGTVTRTNPGAGSVPQDSAIAVYIAVPKSTTIPDLTNMTKDQAIKGLQGMGLTPQIEYQDSDLAKDRVIATSPVAGTKVSPGSAVTVYVSNGNGKD